MSDQQCGFQSLLTKGSRFMRTLRDAVKVHFSSEERPGVLQEAAACGNALRLQLLLRAFPWSDGEVTHALYAVTSRRAARAIARARPRVFQASAPLAVQCAVMREDAAALRALLDAGAPADQPCGSWGETPLHVAAACRKRACALELLMRDVDPNPCDASGDTPLHRAATLGRLGVLWLLVSVGEASVDARCSRMQTPLHRAAAHAHAPCAVVLVGAGASASARDCEGVTPLHLAAAASRAIVETLLQKGADPEATDYSGQRPVHFAAASGNWKAVALLAEGFSVDVNARTRDGTSPMHCAAAGHSVACVRELARLGGDVDSMDRRGLTPLHVAAALGRVEVLRELLRLGARTDLRAENDVSPLMVAVTRGDEMCGRALIEAGADPDEGIGQGYLTLQLLTRCLPDC